MRYVVSMLLLVLLVGAASTVSFGWNENGCDNGYTPLPRGGVDPPLFIGFPAFNAIHSAESRLECLQNLHLSTKALALIEEAKELIAQAIELYKKGDYNHAASLAVAAALKLNEAASLYMKTTGNALPCPEVFPF